MFSATRRGIMSASPFRISVMRRAMSGTAHSPLSGSQEKLLSEKSLQGDLESAAELGRVYFEEDFMKAKPWLELAAELGDTESSYLLGIGLRNLKAAAEEKEDKPDEAKDRDEVLKQINDAKKEARRARKERIKSSRQKTAAGSDGVVVTSSSSSVSYAEDVAEEVETAEHWLRKAAREGHTSAMVLLANILTEEEDSFPKQEALKWYRQAATLQHPDALFNLGTLHFNGIDGGILEPDEKASLAFFEQAAELGDHASQYWVGHCYLSCEGGVAERNTPKAMENLQKAADGGHVAAHYHLAIVYRTGVDESVPADKAAFLRHLQLAVEGDDPDALFCLADCYMQGLDGYPHDQSKAVPYLLKATANEHADAAVTLGALYYGGLAGLKQDKRKAFELYNTAAELGSVDAWRNLAGMYYTGDGVPKNEEVAKQIMKVVFNKDDMDTKPAAAS